MRVYVNTSTIYPTGNGNNAEYKNIGTENGSYYATRVKSDNKKYNTYFGPEEYEYTVFTTDDNKPKVISTQTERSVTVPKLIKDNFNPFNENLARAYENTGLSLSIGGDVGVVGSTLAGAATFPAAVVSGAGLSMELKANYIRGQHSDNYNKGFIDVTSRVGTEVVNKKTKSNYIRAAYEAASSVFKNFIF